MCRFSGYRRYFKTIQGQKMMLNEVDIQDLIKRLKIYKEAHRVALEGLTILSESNTVAKVVLEEVQKICNEIE